MKELSGLQDENDYMDCILMIFLDRGRVLTPLVELKSFRATFNFTITRWLIEIFLELLSSK